MSSPAAPTQGAYTTDEMMTVAAARELTLVALHPGATVEQARAATGWALRVADDLGRTTPPTDEELRVLRELHARTRAARQGSAQ
jgi:glutaconate CoA-transferase subunit B